MDVDTRDQVHTSNHCHLDHPSGAVKIPRKYDFQVPFIWFPDCQHCHLGTIYTRPYEDGGEKRQCDACYSRYLQWLKEHQSIRYVVSSKNYPIRLKVDTSKNLTKSKGRIFYHEVDYQAKRCEETRVEAYAVDFRGNCQEHLWIEGQYNHYFPTLGAAQKWIFHQMGGTLRLFWFI